MWSIGIGSLTAGLLVKTRHADEADSRASRFDQVDDQTVSSGFGINNKEVQQSLISVPTSAPQAQTRFGPSQPSRPQQPLSLLTSSVSVTEGRKSLVVIQICGLKSR